MTATEIPAGVLAELATVCGYHTQPTCEPCEDAARFQLEHRGVTVAELLGDIRQYRDDYPAWYAAQVAESRRRATVRNRAAAPPDFLLF